MSLESSAISREPSRNVLDSPAIFAVTTVPTSTTPWLSGASPTVELRSRSVSCRMRASILPCSSLAAWYPPFSLRSPSSRADSIFFAMSARAGPLSSSSSALSRS
jgi:hypothetical protein